MTTQNVYIFIFDEFSDWEISYATPELYSSKKITLNYVSIDGKSVKSMGGMRITPDYAINQIDPDQVSMLILPGGEAWEKHLISELDGLIAQLHTRSKTIAAICGATIYLAEKGYLDHIQHTSNALPYLKNNVRAYAGDAFYKDKYAVTDGHIITANGIAPIEFARELFRKVDLFGDKHIEKWYQLFKNGIWAT